MMVVKNEHLESNPWLPGELISMFQAAKKPYLEQLHSGAPLDAAGQTIVDLSEIVGDDPLPYGVESSRKTLDTFMQFNFDQKIIPEKVTTDEVFAW